MSLALMMCAGCAVAAAAATDDLTSSRRPCDIYLSHSTPCAAAHAVTRALFVNYTGPLYQLKRFSDNQTLDIHPLAAGGVADAVAHDKFCGATLPQPAPAPAPAPHGLPPLGTAVRLEPVTMYGFVFRHCYNQGFLTPTYDTHGSTNDHIFKLVNALSGTANAFSFESTNFPGMYIAPMPGDDHRPGIVKSPAPLDASWKVAPATNGKGVTLTSLATKYSKGASRGLAIGTNLSGTCAHSYDPPSKNAAIATRPSAWYITRDTGGGSGGKYPARAECVINMIYDQSGNGNHMLPATPAVNNPAYDIPVNATRHPIWINGAKAYGAYFETGMGYRAQNTTKVARGNDPETIYMVTSGTHINAECCFDYGNSENDCDNRAAFCDGCMEAVYFGSGYGGGGKGPWVGADLENGIYGGPYVNDTALHSDFVTAMIKGRTNGFATKAGDARSGSLKTYFDGPRPKRYQPMHKTGAIILGVGGDNSADRRADNFPTSSQVGAKIPGMSIGTFFEGVLTEGITTDVADAEVQADIVAAGYGSHRK